MTSGTAGNETPNFDANGNERGTTINGGTWVDNYDDEDRLTSVAVPSGPTDTFTYNGLGLRVGKTDSTGTYSYVCDGTSPGSPILSDGQAIYTPGLSERRNGVSLFYNSDDLGNLWTAEDGTGKAEAGAYLFTGFGVSLYAGAGAASASPLKYGGANGCQTDVDTGLVMMGCRYYDTRTGRFISQDPIGDGDNWYAYADNSPSNEVDPDGLMPMDGPGSSPQGTDMSVATSINNLEDYTGMSLSSLGQWEESREDHDWLEVAPGEPDAGQKIPGSDTWSATYTWVTDINPSAGMRMFADDESYQQPGESNTHYFFRGLWWAIKQVFTAQPDPLAEGSEDLSKLSRAELKKRVYENNTNTEYSNFFGRKGRIGDPAAGRKLSTEGLEAYKEIARRQVEEGLDKSGTQADRIQKINEELGSR